MKAGDFAKWTAEENGEEFSHIGRIEKINDKRVALQTKKGLMEFSTKDGTLVPHKAVDLTPDEVPEVEASAPVEKTETKVRAPRKKSTGEGPSKQEQVIEIVKSNPEASRKELIDLVVKQLGMTPAGASTYVYNAKQALKKE